jgi:hypothetical protein
MLSKGAAGEERGSTSRREPIACTLDGQGFRHRLDEFRQAFERGYLGGERIPGGVRWRFRAAPELERDLRSLAEREQACCRFFRFDIRTIGDLIHWDTRVDDADAEPVLQEFFTLPSQLLSSGAADVATAPFGPGRRP